MRLRLSVVLTTALVMTVGVITLLGLLVGDDLGALSLLVTVTPIRLIATIFVQLIVAVVALTIVIGIFNLLFVHTTRMIRRGGGRRSAQFGSFVLMASFIGTLLAIIVDRAQGGNRSRILLEDVQVAVEGALAALLFFALVYGAYRLMWRRISLGGIVFVAALLVILIGSLPLPGLTLVQDVRDWLMAVPVNAGARGILLGIALATALTGLRLLIGQDRSYGE